MGFVITCPVCRGKGRLGWSDNWAICKVCNGLGIVTKVYAE